ncbi:MAG: hypothetical protein GOVbin4206_4 [Prokaryotic dsDNA virus sp.]|nr:MAG: hypothetical protein GOVbin4206_4 [Prokaryotic dsDNA virus sp.]|tara:strand:+ start:881 stop:1237 length:357 start_codon:yes stop_codon:yes gene_type:complete
MIEPELLKWVEQYEKVTTVNFMIFGPPLTDEYNDLLAKGINLHLIAEHEMPLHMIFIKEIDEEEARALDTFQGTNLSIVLPENREDISSYVRGVCEHFLKYVRLKNEFIGTRIVANNV